MFLQIITNPIIRQYAVVLIMNLTVLSVGLGLLWPSPMLVKLRNSTETVLDRPITEEEGSWIASIGILVGSLCNFVPALILNRIGRKYTLLISMVPKMVGALMLIHPLNVWMLIIGRMLSGITDMYVFCVVPMYASEIASKEVRGSLGSILQIMSSIGVVAMLGIGPFVTYVTANILFTSVVVVGMLAILLLPESPYFLYVQGRNEECIKLLTSLRGNEVLAKEEIKSYAATETGDKVKPWLVFKDRMFLKSLTFVTIIAIGNHFIGFNAVTYYLQTVLESTQTSVKPEIASVVIGLIQLTASFFTTVVTDKFGRKPILSVTLIGMMIGMIGLGVFFYIKDNSGSVSGFMNFLPLTSLILVVFCYSAGPGSVNWALLAELFDNAGRPVGLGFCSIISGLVLFITVRYFAYVTLTIGPAITYWTFSLNCLLLCIFIVICIPETKGKSFAEIQESLSSKRKRDEEKFANT